MSKAEIKRPIPIILVLERGRRRAKYKAVLNPRAHGLRVTVPAPIVRELELEAGEYVEIHIRKLNPYKSNKNRKPDWEDVPEASSALAALRQVEE